MDLVKLQNESRPRVEEAFSFYVDLLYAIYTAPKPVVCLLDGDVKAGGVGIVAACDAVLSTERTTFEMGEVIFGLIPANVLPYLFALRMSPQKARYLTLVSRKLSAREALDLGLVDELFADEAFEKGARNVLKRLFRSSPSALAEAKAFTAELYGRPFDEVRALARDKFLELTSKEETMRAVEAFNEGETPPWFERYRPEVPLTEKGENQ
jgi:enoyl-CoA hydratase/carnithine racemase